MEMRNKDMGGDFAASGLPCKMFPEGAKAGAAIKYVTAFSQPYFDAGGIASITHVFAMRSWGRSAHAPELDSHGHSEYS